MLNTVPHAFNPRTQKAEVATGLAWNKSKVSNIKFYQTLLKVREPWYIQQCSHYYMTAEIYNSK